MLMHIAGYLGDSAIAQLLLAVKADVNSKHIEGVTA